MSSHMHFRNKPIPIRLPALNRAAILRNERIALKIKQDFEVDFFSLK